MKIDYENYQEEKNKSELNGYTLIGNLIKEKIRLEVSKKNMEKKISESNN